MLLIKLKNNYFLTYQHILPTSSEQSED